MLNSIIKLVEVLLKVMEQQQRQLVLVVLKHPKLLSITDINGLKKHPR